MIESSPYFAFPSGLAVTIAETMKFWPVIMLLAIGHVAFHIAFYNRLNATGLPRTAIKIIKWTFFLIFLSVPVYAVWNRDDDPPVWLLLYACVCLISIAFFGPKWLVSRPSLNSDAISVERNVKRHLVAKEVGEPLTETTKSRFFASLPLNQLLELAIEEKVLPIEGLPSELDGLRVAHLSDIHLTGQISPKFYAYVLARIVEWQPDLIAMTGDIIDKKKCLDWLPSCFGSATAKYGSYFVLGNHDLRIRDPGETRRRLEALGWRNLGGRTHRIDVAGAEVELIGNESPWFPAATIDMQPAGSNCFRFLLSHSPDQIAWARERQVQLMLAGHTHGGQGRLPWIGPVLSPSFYGSRYASGTFYLAPTTMHVTRGLSGVHLLRINCPPELALLTLRRREPR